jgi:hypothetical protein
LRDEWLDAHCFPDLADAAEQIAAWLKEYNENRPHHSRRRPAYSDCMIATVPELPTFCGDLPYRIDISRVNKDLAGIRQSWLSMCYSSRACGQLQNHEWGV